MQKDILYKEAQTNKRATDNISFKLIGLVPLSTLLSFIGVFIKELGAWNNWLYLFGVFGAMIVFGIFRWELRNIQYCNTCSNLIHSFEQELKIVTPLKNEKPKLLGLTMGKTEAEKLIYSTLIIAWLCLPFILKKTLTVEPLDYVYYGFCILILLLTGISVFSKPKK